MLSGTIIAQNDTSKSTINPEILAEMNELFASGIPTVPEVEELRIVADSLYQAEQWSEAAMAYIKLADDANVLANLLSAAMQPYFNASIDAKRSFGYKIDEMTYMLQRSNYFKSVRNYAYLYLGKCYEYQGEVELAVLYLYKALNHLSISEISNWGMGARSIANIVELPKEEKGKKSKK